METLRQVYGRLLKLVEDGEAILVVGTGHKDAYTIHNFYPRKYYESIKHCGFGFFEGRTEHGKFSFDGGGFMRHPKIASGKWISWTPLRASPEVLKDLGYDFDRMKKALKDLICEGGDAGG